MRYSYYEETESHSERSYNLSQTTQLVTGIAGIQNPDMSDSKALAFYGLIGKCL